MKRRSTDRKGKRGLIAPSKSPRKPITPVEMECEEEFASSSAKRLHGKKLEVPCDETFSYCIADFGTIFSGLAESLVCRTCGGDVKFQKKSMRGLGFKLVIFCTKCNDEIKTMNSSPLINNKAYDINRRLAATMRILGKGLSSMQLFCGLMDLPTCITQRPYDTIMQNFEEVATEVVQSSMTRAAKKELEEVKKQHEIELVDNGIIVSGDGTWMKRGFSSLYGVTTLIANSTGKVVDFVVKSAYCKDCEHHKQNLNDADFEIWFANHEESCSINHTGSAGKMEPDAMLTMFKRSEELYGVKYQYYIGDGDSKTFSTISNAKPYNDVEVTKKECIGHVQKRMGSRLRKLLTDFKKTQTSVKEPGTSRTSLSGKGKLTAKLIDELTTYYGLAIRNNINSLENMRNAIWATFYHKISTDENPQHMFCPPGSDSWCYWQKAKADGTTVKHKPPLHEVVQQAIKPLYTALSNDDLLKRCLGGFTQNSNESLNARIWLIAPKCTPGSKRIVSIASSVAVANYNDGADAHLRIFDMLGITIGRTAINYCKLNDANRLRHARISTYLATKEARMNRKLQRTITNSDIQNKEGIQYEAGMAD